MTHASDHQATENRPDPATHANGHDRLEREIRARYADATTHLSARTQAQLRLRLRAAIIHPRPARQGHAWWLATACSVALLVVVGVQWRAGHGAATSVSPEPARVVLSEEPGELVATLDETPDLYLWLASDDANALATE